MSQAPHTYGPTCHLAKPFTSSTSSSSGSDIPDMKVHFFYSSPLPIDDPLSAVPTSGGSDTKTANYPPRPFSAVDNNALEEAWLGLGSERDRKHHYKTRAKHAASVLKDPSTRPKSIYKKKSKPQAKGGIDGEPSSKSIRAQGDNVAEAVNKALHENMLKKLAADQETRLKSEAKGNPFNAICDDPHHAPFDYQVPVCCAPISQDSQSEANAADDGDTQECADYSNRRKPPEKAKGATFGTFHYSQEEVPVETRKNKPKDQESSQSHSVGLDPELLEMNSKDHKAFEKHEHSKSHRVYEQHLKSEHAGQAPDMQASEGKSKRPKSTEERARSPVAPEVSPLEVDNGTTGAIFAKLPSRTSSPISLATHTEDFSSESFERASYPKLSRKTQDQDSAEAEIFHDHKCSRTQKNTARNEANVPVGISRLHLVSLPSLQMKPIYWSPVHDVAVVIRASWFYKNSMYPVEPAVANQLEIGYRELRPWSQTWNDELNSAIEVGAAGEEKISHPLWPKDEDRKLATQYSLSTDPYCAARCFYGEASAECTLDPDNASIKRSDETAVIKRYSNSHIIYKDASNAFILKPTLQPSAYHGRKPLQKIKKGTSVGIQVVRGFDWEKWEKLHPSKKTSATTKVEKNAPVAGDANSSKGNVCSACKLQEGRKQVTDLVLVIHGIGQKLSERVESFHFTHAINAFRRSINVELANESVKRVLREDLGGVMILPVNWRSNLSFEDGGPMKDGEEAQNTSEFSLKDITPNTIPAVRNIMSDVLLDIPYFMSKNKPKMIQALISEANRVYRLWVKNNPGFHKEGRVHIIAHSLGSAMAMEVLSKQPTMVSSEDPSTKKFNVKHFDFNTTNIFFVGSPAAIFLLLERGRLIPRNGQNKPGSDATEFTDKSIVSDMGVFGSMAVHNVYNILHYNDPIAYRLNATVDPQYASLLKSAVVPSASTGFFESIGNAVKSMTPGGASTVDLAVGQLAKPAPVARLPSQLEMEVHDFTAEEKAERKFFLLNDNGQVDWFLSTGGGPLEIQYLNMLSAHSSYWGSPDFVRLVVTEVGRQPGRDHTMPNMKAVKIRPKS
jgi:hypothetical protein